MKTTAMRSLLLAVALAVGAPISAGAAAPAAPVASPGVVAPARFTVECLARVAAQPVLLGDGLVLGSGNGRCTMTGDFGAPWIVQVRVNLQTRTAGKWRTRAIAISSVENQASTKRIRDLWAGYTCTAGAAGRPWRIRVIAEALANEKVVTRLTKATATSQTANLAC